MHPDHYAEGVAFFFHMPDHPSFCCKWVTVGEYLRRPFRHYRAAQTVSRWALDAAQAATNVGWQAISGPANDWRSPSQALVILNRYVFIKWSFTAPMLEPLSWVFEEVRQMQTTVLVLMLKLNLRACLPQDIAILLNRHRRRAAQQLLRLRPSRQWFFSVVKRNWTFAGHCLRRGENSLETFALLAPCLEVACQWVGRGITCCLG